MGRLLCSKLQSALCRQPYQPSNLFLIKADDYLAINVENRNGEPAALFRHFCALFKIGLYVVIRERHVIFAQPVLGHVAEVAGRGAVNGDVFSHIVGLVALV